MIYLNKSNTYDLTHQMKGFEFDYFIDQIFVFLISKQYLQRFLKVFYNHKSILFFVIIFLFFIICT